MTNRHSKGMILLSTLLITLVIFLLIFSIMNEALLQGKSMTHLREKIIAIELAKSGVDLAKLSFLEGKKIRAHLPGKINYRIQLLDDSKNKKIYKINAIGSYRQSREVLTTTFITN